MKLSRIQLLAFLMMVMSVLTSCRDELCYDHYPTLSIDLSWEKEWERDYGMNHPANWDAALHGFEYDDIRPIKPEWVNMVIGKADGSFGETHLTPEGGKVNVELGDGQTYLLYNGDTEYITLSDITSFSDARASATSRSRAGMTYFNEHHPDVRSTSSPDVIFSAFVDKAHAFEIHEHVSLGVKMQPLVFTYIIRYEFEYGLDHVSLARGALGGMAESAYLLDGRTSDNSSIILYDCDVKDYGCEAHVRSFGIPGFPDEYYGRADSNAPDRPYSLNLEILLKNGKTVEFNYDIADQMKKQPRGGVITVKNIRIEDQIGESDSGFDVSVTDWPNHDVIDLPIEVEP
ncbi:MAG: DUF5119 domain-containing protein [Muribaculaceae bacterium]|nr:DUF5119 domain-containing protein [Muribaculaceae bacterium]